MKKNILIILTIMLVSFIPSKSRQNELISNEEWADQVRAEHAKGKKKAAAEYMNSFDNTQNSINIPYPTIPSLSGLPTPISFEQTATTPIFKVLLTNTHIIIGCLSVLGILGYGAYQTYKNYFGHQNKTHS